METIREEIALVVRELYLKSGRLDSLRSLIQSLSESSLRVCRWVV